jgi:esterase/lipase superfamily enzyme
MDWSEPHLESFLGRIASSSGARTIHVIAHSMGNRVLTKALKLLVARRRTARSLFRHVVLTAPDIDANTFLDLARVILPVGKHLTLYSNPRDRSLLLSRLFNMHQRAGATIVIVAGLDTIDASRVDTSLVRHSHFGSRTVLADIASMFRESLPPGKRFGMKEKRSRQGRYYLFRP